MRIWKRPPLLSALAVFLASGLAVVGCGVLGTGGPSSTPSPATATPAQAASRPSPTVAANPTVSPGLQDAIVVLEPKPSQSIGSPVRIAGHARVYEGTVRFEVVDAKGEVVGKGFTTATAGAPEVGYFSAEILFTRPQSDTPGVIRVFGDDPREGKRVGLVEVPVTLVGTTPAATAAATPAGAAAGRTLTLKLYFTKVVANDLQFIAVERTIPHTLQMGRASIEELLKGPNEAERRSGLETAIPVGAKLNSLRIENGVAYADFNEKLQEGVGGSLRVMSIRRQITLTLQQFSTVRNVVISINGQTEDILQP